MRSKPCISIPPGSLREHAQPSASIFAERKSSALLPQHVNTLLGENSLTNWRQKRNSSKNLKFLNQCPIAKSGEKSIGAMEHFAKRTMSVSQDAADLLSLSLTIVVFRSSVTIALDVTQLAGVPTSNSKTIYLAISIGKFSVILIEILTGN